MPLSTAQVLNNRYRIVKLLGQGGFGAVYRAWDLHLKRPFALKENLDLSHESVRQFEREASFLSEISHPNLPRVIDYFHIVEQGQYLVMDFIEGETLEEKLVRSGGALLESQVIPWIVQVSDALTFLHTQKPPVIHRDVKPANIKITPEGKAVLVDFGIAKAYFGHQQTTLGARAVTEGYSPPEQYGVGTTDPRSDVYALGATLYHALTGQRPVESVHRHLGSDLVDPRRQNADISSRAEAAILKAMAVDIDRRYSSSRNFKVALESQVNVLPLGGADVGRYQQEVSSTFDETLISHPPRIPSAEVPPTPTKKSIKGVFLRSGIVILGILCSLLVGMGSLWVYFGYLKETATPTPSPTQVVVTEIPTSTDIPILVPTDESTQAPADPSPTWVPSKTNTPSPSPPGPTETTTEVLGEWNPCPNAYVSRLHVNDLAYVSHYPPLKNNVRSDPDLNASKLGTLNPGEEMRIIDGPECANNMVWWKIRAIDKFLNGWTSEGDMENYWLVPLP